MKSIQELNQTISKANDKTDEYNDWTSEITLLIGFIAIMSLFTGIYQVLRDFFDPQPAIFWSMFLIIVITWMAVKEFNPKMDFKKFLLKHTIKKNGHYRRR